MSEPEEASGDSSEPTESLPPEQWERSPQPSSERTGASAFQKAVKQAISGSEFRVTVENGVTVRRRSPGLHISYNDCLQYLGM